jgi:hypothetical protein
MKDRQDKLKGMGANDAEKVGGILGRYMTHNTQQVLQRPGMDQFAISIKLKNFNKTAKDDSMVEGPNPFVLSSGSQLCFPKGVALPECLRQRPASEQLQKVMAERESQQSCSLCGSSTLVKKYKCPKSGKVTCSLDCYKKQRNPASKG